ncbi:beta-lactamase/transpeptidase-like protein [Corynespora cassiicola Philippines]|uniref:Beta-lactamase/transpeptidase-like protein n=1 Tax=Corynespora cassiicola Philippines TaxID=1448308 RepID=A0A2T2NHQ4_CORCC|nr:beta-lactamase/transpeptidase-like protein [Corynespora cassiicola Philippines]
MSAGVLHHGQMIHTKHFGYRQISSQTPPDNDTIYRIASLTKLMTMCAVGCLVGEEVLQWDTPICQYLPEFSRRLDDVGTRSTLRDLGSNRTGIASADFFWTHKNGQLLTPKDQLVPLSTVISVSRKFRQSFVYSPWNYVLIQAIIEKVTKKSFGTVLQEKIFDPLGLQRTTCEEPDGSNISSAYAVADDGSAESIKMTPLSPDTGLTAVMGVKSTIIDMLIFYSAVLLAYKDQMQLNVDSIVGSPLHHLRTILAPHISVNKNTSLESQAYCLGTYRTALPGHLSRASLNASLLRTTAPTFGSDLYGMEIFHHTGNISGNFHSMFLVPETQSAVICLTNATPLMDASDFCAQILLGVVLGSASKLPYVQLAGDARERQLNWYARLSSEIASRKSNLPPREPLSSYAGTYSNAPTKFSLQIVQEGPHLNLIVQGHSNTSYILKPYDQDTLYWEANRNRELCQEGMFPRPHLQVHLIRFWKEGGTIKSLSWHHDPNTDPFVFKKEHQSGHLKL